MLRSKSALVKNVCLIAESSFKKHLINNPNQWNIHTFGKGVNISYASALSSLENRVFCFRKISVISKCIDSVFLNFNILMIFWTKIGSASPPRRNLRWKIAYWKMERKTSPQDLKEWNFQWILCTSNQKPLK